MLTYKTDNSYKQLLKIRLVSVMASLLCLLILAGIFAPYSIAETVLFIGVPYAKATNETQTSGLKFNLVSDKGDKPTSSNNIVDKNAMKVAMNTTAPTILIYHTHTLEAYTPTLLNPYTEKGGKWRTTDNSKNIVYIGELLAQELRMQGFNVIHDITNHEPPELSSAYERSEATMKKYKAQFPSITMFIDLHRDAAGEASTNDFVIIDGEEAARIMFVVGSGRGATGSGFAEMPKYEYNLALADAISEQLSMIHPDFMRPTRIKTGRYNQHISSQCLLIEVGHNMNTLEQAINAVKHLAKAITAVCG